MYAFRVTAKQNIGGGKSKIAKGTSVQVVEQNCSSPQVKTVLEAYKQQLGVDISGISATMGYFTVEKL